MRIGLAGVGRIGAFHAETLRDLPGVDEVVVADALPDAARAVADTLGVGFAATAEELLASGLDGFVVATATPGHAPLLRAGVAAGVPTFCEKPVAATLEETVELARLVAGSDVPVHVGFQRRFDAGYRRAKAAVDAGELGFVHSVRSQTHDEAPPHASYVPGSGGIFRDCNVHDFDVLRFVTGHEVVTAYAAGGNKGADFFRDAGDVDTAAALLTLDDGTLVTVTSTRYHGAGHDVRMEVAGSEGTIGVGYDDSLALRSAEEGASYPAGPVHHSFMDRFLPAYRAELTAFVEVARGERPSPCTVDDALQAFRTAEACDRSRREGRIVHLDEVPGA
ncbi:Gfo/Idh/MocA family protein [Lapillicoccus jejuensis]|uniref:Myo-inositol 2-dehydrogenase/D-chiro-inositol 1-dehydrogenase n=1 Tax=Lapillicoccus jejuensis TaxID=402171 RepID=A0A542E5B0_9MICO|nr:Gfo/Idh/MocA family oxidoreductase [Lapillicoccus jejuensis]TQJ10528.1 myo-inositol 2-dehydrogenase/D-chiro-inositol 1-dehydrogenase [Lapillicoccus jejuensis]